MKKIEITAIEKNKIIRLKSEGKSIREICRIINHSQSFVQRILNEDLYLKNKYDKSCVAVCKKTNKEFRDFENKSGCLTSHISKEYPDIIIPSKFIRNKFKIENGISWYHDFFTIKKNKTEKNKVLKCRLCSWESIDLCNLSGSFTKHIVKEHNIDSKKYIKIFPEDKHLFKTFVKKQKYKFETLSNKENFIKCYICGEKMRKITNTHLKKHGLSLLNYKKKFGTTMSESTREKFVKIGINNSKSVVMSKRDTNIEIKIKNILKKLNIDYIQQFYKNNYYFDFFLKDKNILLETDGDYWHGYDRGCNWDYGVFNNVINDFKKSKSVENLYRIREININDLKIDNFKTKECFYKFIEDYNVNISEHKIFNLKENDNIFEKLYCINKFDITNKNTLKLIDNILFLLKNFYSPNMADKFIDLNSRKNINFKIKGIFFKQFYSAHKIKNKNMFELFNSDELLLKVIKYRLGINKNKEFFDFNIKNIYRGIEVRTLFNVGVFTVKKCKEIYKSNVNYNDLIFDPFAGWGSRVISLKNILNDKKCNYIGNDINKSLKEGYDYILKNEIHNNSVNNINLNIRDSTILDKSLIKKVDFIFTSPPFFNDEIYENSTILFKSIDDWSKHLLIPVFNNCFKYLKPGKKMVIDMKELYCEETIKSAEKCGFKLLYYDEYNVAKTHYSKKNKKQFLLTFVKN